MLALKKRLLHPSILRKLMLLMIFGFIIPLILFNTLFWLVLSRNLKTQAEVSYDALNRQIAVGLDTTLKGGSAVYFVSLL